MAQPDHGDFVLLVQTDPIVGLDLADALAGAGYRVSEPAWTAAEAERCLADRNPALAVIDLATADGAGPRLLRQLRRRGVPILVCAEREGAPDPSAEFADVPCLAKPAWHRDVVDTMAELAARAGRVE
mgnify:CR=1 FL=1